jgi:hypothetical protein
MLCTKRSTLRLGGDVPIRGWRGLCHQRFPVVTANAWIGAAGSIPAASIGARASCETCASGRPGQLSRVLESDLGAELSCLLHTPSAARSSTTYLKPTRSTAIGRQRKRRHARRDANAGQNSPPTELVSHIARCEARRVVGRGIPSLTGLTSLLFRVREYAQPIGAGPISGPALIPREVCWPRTPAPSSSPNSRLPLASTPEAGRERPGVRAFRVSRAAIRSRLKSAVNPTRA